MLMTQRNPASCTAWFETITLKLELPCISLCYDFERIHHPFVLQLYFDSFSSFVCIKCGASLFYSCLLCIGCFRLFASLAFDFLFYFIFLQQLSLFDVKVILKLSETLRWVWHCEWPLSAERSNIIIINIKEFSSQCLQYVLFVSRNLFHPHYKLQNFSIIWLQDIIGAHSESHLLKK